MYELEEEIKILKRRIEELELDNFGLCLFLSCADARELEYRKLLKLEDEL